MMSWFLKPKEYLVVETGDDEDEEITHGPWNNWECDDPSCCCHDAEESTTGIPVPWRALQKRS